MTDQAHPDVQTSQEEEAEASPFADLRFGELVDNMYALRTEKEELMAAAKKLAKNPEGPASRSRAHGRR